MSSSREQRVFLLANSKGDKFDLIASFSCRNMKDYSIGEIVQVDEDKKAYYRIKDKILLPRDIHHIIIYITEDATHNIEIQNALKSVDITRLEQKIKLGDDY